MRKHRILWLDFIKGLCIFMVVFYHAIYFSGKSNFDNSWIEIFLKYIFDILMMPCFFAVSGYLYKSVKTVRNYIMLLYKKFTAFIVPYIVFYCVFAIYYSNNHLHFWPIFNIKDIIIKPDGDLWFLQVLLFIFVLVGALDLLKINNNYQLIIFLVLLFIFLILIEPILPHVHVILQIFDIIFFLSGEFIRRHIDFIKEHNYIFISLFVISFIIMMLTAPFRYDAQFISINTIIPKLLGVFAMFSLCSNLSSNNKVFLYFTKIGKYTLVVYIVHFIPILILDYYFDTLTKCLLLNSLFITALAWIISIAICYLVEEISMFNFIFYPRKYINKIIGKTKFGKKSFN